MINLLDIISRLKPKSVITTARGWRFTYCMSEGIDYGEGRGEAGGKVKLEHLPKQDGIHKHLTEIKGVGKDSCPIIN